MSTHVSSIAIIGTGLMSKALGSAWSRVGHPIRIGSRDPESVTKGNLGFRPQVIGDYREALVGSDVVVLAMPFKAVAPFVSEYREALAGKTIIDISNPFDALPHNGKAAAEYTAEALGTTRGLVAAYKDNFAATINAPAAADGAPIDVKIAGDDEEAKAVVSALATELGHRVIDCGALSNARLLDPMVSLMLVLDRAYTGFTMRSGWKSFGIPIG